MVSRLWYIATVAAATGKAPAVFFIDLSRGEQANFPQSKLKITTTSLCTRPAGFPQVITINQQLRASAVSSRSRCTTNPQRIGGWRNDQLHFAMNNNPIGIVFLDMITPISEIASSMMQLKNRSYWLSGFIVFSIPCSCGGYSAD